MSVLRIADEAMKRFKVYYLYILLLGLIACQKTDSQSSQLAVRFEGKYGQVEVGGDFVGAEFHQSRPLPSRISFYYPVANSIDLSTDYWKRYESQPLTATLLTEKPKNSVWTLIPTPTPLITRCSGSSTRIITF